jgi:hypothetical protein
MSYLPIYVFPSGNIINISDLGDNVTYKWIDSLGGDFLEGPLIKGDFRPDGKKANNGIATKSLNGQIIIEYHHT